MFTLIPHDELSPKHFEQHPAWADYSDPDDIEMIASWGIARADIVRDLERVDYSDKFVFPVLRTSPLPSFRFLYLSAQLTAADGTQFRGYVIGQHPYCFAVYHGSEVFTFNVNLQDLGQSQLTRLRHSSRLALSPFFPLRYSTRFRRDNGQRIEGVFDYPRNAEPSS